MCGCKMERCQLAIHVSALHCPFATKPFDKWSAEHLHHSLYNMTESAVSQRKPSRSLSSCGFLTAPPITAMKMWICDLGVHIGELHVIYENVIYITEGIRVENVLKAQLFCTPPSTMQSPASFAVFIIHHHTIIATTSTARMRVSRVEHVIVLVICTDVNVRLRSLRAGV